VRQQESAMADLSSAGWTARDRGAEHARFLHHQHRAAADGSDLTARLGLSPGHTLLDVGCGEGGSARAIKAETRTLRVVGIDPSLQLLSMARKADPSVTYIQGDGKRLPLRSSSIDRVLCQRVLMHLETPSFALGEINRVLRLDGVVMCVEPAWSRFRFVTGYLDLDLDLVRWVQQGVRWPSMGADLPRLMGEAGFNVLAAEWHVIKREIDPNRFRAVAQEVVEHQEVSADRLSNWFSAWTKPGSMTVSHVRQVIARPMTGTGGDQLHVDTGGGKKQTT
jgi:SAM-dependent methyltransferase